MLPHDRQNHVDTKFRFSLVLDTTMKELSDDALLIIIGHR